MTALVEVAAWTLAGAGVLLGIPVAAVAGLRTAATVVLDLLLAAGLLRLTADPAWDLLLTTAAIVALRQLVSAGMRVGREALGDPPLWRPWQAVHHRH